MMPLERLQRFCQDITIVDKVQMFLEWLKALVSKYILRLPDMY